MSAEEAYEAVLVETARLNHVSETAASALQKYENGEISERTFIEAIEAELTARHQRTAHNAIHEQVKRMHAGKPQVVQYTNGWSVLLNNHSSTLFLLLLLGLLITPVIPAEYRTEMLPFLFTTKKGKNNLFASKLIAVLLSAIGSLLMIELSELVCIAVRYGLPNGLFPVQSVQQFEDCPWNLTALNAYAVRLLLRVLGVCYLSILLYILTIWMKRTVPALIAGFGITLLPLGVFGETKKIFTLPIPLGLLRAAEYLQGKCTIRQTQIELTRGEILFAVLFSCLIMIMLSVCSMFPFYLRRKKTIFVLLCIPLVSCGSVSLKADYYFDHSILMRHQADSEYRLSLNTDNLLTVSGPGIDGEAPLLHNMFPSGNTVLFPAYYTEGSYAFRLETEYGNTAENATILTDRVIRTNLEDFSETLLYEETLTGKQHDSLLGLDQYLPLGFGQTDSAQQFAVNGDYIVLISFNGIYLSEKGKHRLMLAEGETLEWEICGNRLYFISEDYLLHSIDLTHGQSATVSDVPVNALTVSEQEVRAVPIDRTKELIIIRAETGS